MTKRNGFFFTLFSFFFVISIQNRSNDDDDVFGERGRIASKDIPARLL